jgi:uncharacterized protein (TIGR00255 family)
VKSMTGFGRSTATLPDGTEVSVIVKGVNHRFLDVAVKLRDEYAALEPDIRRAVGRAAVRGHVDVVVRTVRPEGRSAAFDEETAARYARLWAEAAERRGLPAALTARDLLGLPGVVRAEGAESEADEKSAGALLAAVENALRDFDATRVREGASVAAALDTILVRLEAAVGRLDVERTGLSDRLAAALQERIAKLAAAVPLDEARLAQEVALLADRADISEEIDRLRTHLAEIRRLCAAEGPTGKRLDHLAQELHREANTSGQKVREAGATRFVLDLKSDIEAFKEQVQNVE